jgi:hypothetical protein
MSLTIEARRAAQHRYERSAKGKATRKAARERRAQRDYMRGRRHTKAYREARAVLRRTLRFGPS